MTGPERAPLWERAGAFLLWYVLPGFAFLAVSGYLGLAIVWHANPPVVPVTGISMRPFLHAGDLVFVKGVKPGALKKGDVIAFRVPKSLQQKYDVPANYVHRIVAIQPAPNGYHQYRTKGDAVAGPDPFWTSEQDVIGEYVTKVSYLGYPLLFLHSRQGEIFLLALGVLVVLYFLLGLYERRQDFAEANALTLSRIVEEARELKDSMARAGRGPRAPPSAPAPPGPRRCSRGDCELPEWARFDPHTGEELSPPPEPEPAWELGEAAIDFETLEAEIHRAVGSSEEVREVMGELVGAVGEYGEHLRSHTEVMQNLAATTRELQGATEGMRELLEQLAQVVVQLAQERRER